MSVKIHHGEEIDGKTIRADEETAVGMDIEIMVSIDERKSVTVVIAGRTAPTGEMEPDTRVASESFTKRVS